MNRLAMFPGADPAQVASLAGTIGGCFALAAAQATTPMMDDASIPPDAMCAAIIEAHMIGMAAAIAAAADAGLTTTTNRAELINLAHARLDRLIAAVDRVSN